MWTYIISNTNRSSQCNCSPIAVLHTEDVVRLPKTCFSLVKTGSYLVISKPLIFYQYWMQEWEMFLSRIQWESLWDWKRAIVYLRTSTFSEFTALVLALFFCMNTYIRWCDHAVALVRQFLAWGSTWLSDVCILHGPYLLYLSQFLWEGLLWHQRSEEKLTWFIVDLKGNLPWTFLGAQLQLILSSKTFPKSPTQYVKPHLSHAFLIVMA